MKQFLVIALIVLVIVGGIAFYLFDQEKAAGPVVESPAVQSPPPIAQAPGPESEPEPETPPPFVVGEKASPGQTQLDELPLPPLNESDDYVRENLESVVGEAATMQYFASEGLVTRIVATVDMLGSRQVPGNIQAIQGPGGSFAASEDPNPPTIITNEVGDPIPQYLSDPANTRRYVAYVEMLEAIDAGQFAALYRKNYPLFQQAWRELGYTRSDFDGRLVEVIDDLLATPSVEEPYRLIKPEAVYVFADEELESLSAGQKIMLRMGSDNAARVKSKLSEFREAL